MDLVIVASDGGHIPTPLNVGSATPDESQLLIGDKTHDSDSLDERHASQYRIELIARHKSN